MALQGDTYIFAKERKTHQKELYSLTFKETESGAIVILGNVSKDFLRQCEALLAEILKSTGTTEQAR